MVTLDDVAARAGVSRMTASNALRGKAIVRPETVRRVLEAASAIGYHPNIAARRLSSGYTHIIGLTVTDFDLIFPADLAACISDQAQRRNYQVIVQQTRLSHDFEQRMLASPTAQICDGTIICWPSSQPAEISAFARAQPLTLLDGFNAQERCDCVFTPCADGMAAMTRHLAVQGYRNVLILGGDYLDPADFSIAGTSAQLRIKGAAKGLHSHGLQYAPDTVIPCGWSRDAGYHTTKRLINQRRSFDALCCVNDPIAIGALTALNEAGIRVPQDVAVTGFDGVADGRYLTPQLTTVTINPGEVAEACLDLLIARIEERHMHNGGSDTTGKLQPAPPRTVTARYTLTERGSAERV